MSNIESLLAGLAAPTRKTPEDVENEKARQRARASIVLGQRLGLGRPATEEEARAFLMARQQVLGSTSTRELSFVPPPGEALPSIENVYDEKAPYIDEIDKYLMDKHDALRKHGGDQFRAFQHMQLQKVQELGAQAQFTRQNPQSAMNALLGNAVTLTGSQTDQILQSAARWTGDDAESTNVTVTMGAAGQPVPTGQVNHGIRPFGLLKWGTKGISVQAEVDIGNGVQVTVGCSFIDLQVGLDSGQLGTATLTGMISFRQVPHGVAPTRTRYLAFGTGTTLTNIVIPPFARNWILYTDTIGQTYTVTVKALDSQVIYVYTTTANVVMTTPLELPGDAALIDVTTNVAGSNARLVFQLGL